LKKIKLLIKITFIVLAFVIIFSKIDINQLKNIHLKNPLWLFIGFMLFNISQIISALRVHLYLQNIKITPTFKKQVMLYYVGMFYNTLLPGGIGGDAYKAYKFEKSYQKGYKLIIKALLIDRISGLFAIFFLLGILLSAKFSWLFIIITFFTPILLLFIKKTLFKEFSFLPFVFSIIVQLLQMFTFLAILLSLGINSHIIDFLILFFISSIVSVIPISIGGVGLRELTFLYGLEYLHLNPAYGVIGAFLFFVISIISSAIGAIFLKGVKNV
jgi:uncharacterized membrane protein YbhN (UPF0104 family)